MNIDCGIYVGIGAHTDDGSRYHGYRGKLELENVHSLDDLLNDSVVLWIHISGHGCFLC